MITFYSREFKLKVITYKRRHPHETDREIAAKFNVCRENVRNWTREASSRPSMTTPAKKTTKSLAFKREVLKFRMIHADWTIDDVAVKFEIPSSALISWWKNRHQLLANTSTKQVVTNELVQKVVQEKLMHPERTFEQVAQQNDVSWNQAYAWFRGAELGLSSLEPDEFVDARCMAFVLTRLQLRCPSDAVILSSEVFARWMECHIHHHPTELQKESPLDETLLNTAEKMHVFIPINHVFGLHWSLIHVDRRSNRITHHNPHTTDRGEALKIVDNFMTTSLTKVVNKYTACAPCDSGVLMMLCILAILNHVEIPDASTIPSLRRGLAALLVENKLDTLVAANSS